MSFVRSAISWLAWPGFVLGGMAAVHVVIGKGVPPPAALVALQLVMMLVVGLLERWMPEHDEWNQPKQDVVTDALYLVVSGAMLSGILRTAIFAGVPSLRLWPESWPIAAQVFLAIALADLGSYGTHVLEHKASWL